MDNFLSSSPQNVPSIHILNPDGASALFDDRDFLAEEMFRAVSNVGLHTCAGDTQPEYFPSNFLSGFPAELDDIKELSHLTTTPLTGYGYSLPYSAILQESSTTTPADGLSPSRLSTSASSPTSSFSSLSPTSLFEYIPISDSESSFSPSPTTPDQQFTWPAQGFSDQNSDSLVQLSFVGSLPSDPIPPSASFSSLTHRRSKSSPSSRREPVASKAMLEANSRRRRHPAQFQCSDCEQTFTALFSLKRHAQSHTGERPFACGIPGCNQRFYNSSDCKRHEKSKKRHKDLVMQ